MSIVQVLLGGYRTASAPVGLAWDSSTGTAVVSNGGLTATGTNGLFGTLGKSSGKWLVEYTSTVTNGTIGLADKTNGNAVLSNFIGAGAQEAVGYRNSGQWLAALSTGTVNSTGHPSYNSASTLGIALDFTTSPPTMTFYINGTIAWTLATLPTGKTWYPVFYNAASASVTFNTSPSFPVSGFTYWA